MKGLGESGFVAGILSRRRIAGKKRVYRYNLCKDTRRIPGETIDHTRTHRPARARFWNQDRSSAVDFEREGGKVVGMACFEADRRVCTTQPTFDYGKCIRCYCCQELCPNDAIKLQQPLLARMLGG